MHSLLSVCRWATRTHTHTHTHIHKHHEDNWNQTVEINFVYVNLFYRATESTPYITNMHKEEVDESERIVASAAVAFWLIATSWGSKRKAPQSPSHGQMWHNTSINNREWAKKDKQREGSKSICCHYLSSIFQPLEYQHVNILLFLSLLVAPLS